MYYQEHHVTKFVKQIWYLLTRGVLIIKVEKKDKDTNKPIEGVTFQLRTEDGKVVQNATSNDKRDCNIF